MCKIDEKHCGIRFDYAFPVWKHVRPHWLWSSWHSPHICELTSTPWEAEPKGGESWEPGEKLDFFFFWQYSRFRYFKTQGLKNHSEVWAKFYSMAEGRGFTRWENFCYPPGKIFNTNYNSRHCRLPKVAKSYPKEKRLYCCTEADMIHENRCQLNGH